MNLLHHQAFYDKIQPLAKWVIDNVDKKNKNVLLLNHLNPANSKQLANNETKSTSFSLRKMASSKRSHTMFDSNTLNLHQPQTTGQLLSNFTNTLGYTLSNTLNTKSHSGKQIHVAVVGLSGTEKEKGCLGVGKSCLCNRFVRPSSDDYNYEHISVLSQTDFSGRIVNGEHFLWWGEVTKFNDYYYEKSYFNNNSTLLNNSSNYVNFSVIEETTFIDDTSFQPFNSGKLEPYIKRIQNLKLHSSEKLMYVCKNQLGIEKEYPQKYLPDGKFAVDGFICVFDVSVIQGRTLDTAIEQTSIILSCLVKTKKPIVVATTKNDESNEYYVREIERLIQRKEFRNYNIQLVETSAHENINVDQAFFVLAQLIDKKVKCKPSLTYLEALRLRKEHMDLVYKSYYSLITNRFFDPNLKWIDCSNWICDQPEYYQYCELFGNDNARKIFSKHIKTLQDQLVHQKLQVYLKILPQVLSLLLDENFEEEVIASNQLSGRISNADLNLSTLWNLTKMRLIEHPEFNNFFIICPHNMRWQEESLIQRSNNINETMIPFDVLETPEAEQVFSEFRNALKMNFKRVEMKMQFKQLLEEHGYITPGKPLDEVRVLFMGRNCYENLSEQSIVEIYEEHQQAITERAKLNFQELLLEHLDLFFAYASMNEIITQEDLMKINQQIKDDIRFKALDNLEQERTLILLKHLGFIHNPLKEHCPAFPQCIDVLTEQTMALTSRKYSLSHTNPIFQEDKYNELNLILIGFDQLAEELASLLKNTNANFKKDNFRFSLDFRLINGNFDIEEQTILQNSCSSNSLNHGCFCIYSNAFSLDYIRNCLERSFLSNMNENDLLFNGLPIIIILFSSDYDLSEEEAEFLKEEGQNMAKRYQAIFLDISNLQKHPELKYEEQLLNAMIDQMEHRAEFLSLINQSATSQQEMHQKFIKQLSTIEQDCPADIRILMCLFCGDIYSVEQVITPFLEHCLKTKNKIKATSTSSFIIKMMINNSMKTVEFLLTSYHNAIAYRDELLHGFFLVFSTVRKASLASLISFTNNIPNTPTVIYGQTADLLLLSDQHMYFDEELSNQLIQQSSLFAKKINAHYALSNMFFDSKGTIDNDLNLFKEFFQEVQQRKPQIEKAFEIDVDQDFLKQQHHQAQAEKLRPIKQQRSSKPQIKAATKKLPPLPTRQESLNLRKIDYKKHSVESLQKDFLDEEDGDEDEDLNQDLSDEKLRVTEEDDDDRYEQLPIITEDINTKNRIKQQKQKYESELSATPSPIITTPSGTDDSEIYATIFNQNTEHLLKPSQIKSRRQLQTDMLHKIYQSCESLDYVKQHSHQSSKQHSPGIHTQAYAFSPSPNYQQNNVVDKVKIGHQRKLPAQQQSKVVDQTFNYGQSSSSLGTFHDYSNCSSKHSPSQSIKSPVLESGNLVLQTFRNENQRNNLSNKQQQSKQKQSIYGTASRKCFATERSHSMLDASHFQLKKHQHFFRQQQSIANELKEKQRLKQQKGVSSKDFLPMYHVKENKSSELLNDELSEEDTPSSELSEPPEPEPSIGSCERQFPDGISYPERVKSKPGKLNLSEFDNITNAVGRINLSKNYLPKMSEIEKADYSTTSTSSTQYDQVKQPDPTYGYPLMRANVENYTYKDQFSKKLNENASDSDSEDSLSEPKKKFISKKKTNIRPIAPPLVPERFLVEKEQANKFKQQEIESALLQQQPQEKSNIKFEQQENKRMAAADKKKAKEELKKAKKKMKSKSKDKRNSLIFSQSDNLIPLFMAKCISFIEEYGLDLEGLYRVPGNRCQVDYLFERFDDDPHFSIKECDVPVNAVATALKDFVSKKLPNLMPNEFLEDLRTMIAQEEPNKMNRLSQFKCLLNKLPTMNFNILKYLFQHFAKVAQNSRFNSMDTKNISICWWPTLLPFEFSDMIMFESMRPSLEELVQSLIEEHEFVFNES